MGHFHAVSRLKFDIDSVEGGAPVPLSLRSELNTEIYHLTALIQLAQFKGKRKDVKALKAQKDEISEQLRILKAFDPRIVRLMERVVIRRFREQTR